MNNEQNMMSARAGDAGVFMIGGKIPVNRVGYGAMRIMGEGFWGEPDDRDEVLRTLRRLPEIGVNFVDTADSYGPAVSENLIREALHPYAGILIATKAGMLRTGPFRWKPHGNPDYLIQQANLSRARLGVERIALWQLHRIAPDTPREEQFDAVRSLVADGVIEYVGLSEVSVEDIEAAAKFFKVATVQNRFNLIERQHGAVLRYCEERSIGFIPYFPLASGNLAKPGGPLGSIAERHNATPAQICVAWLLQHSPVMLPIPGTSQRAHAEENVAAARIRLSAAEMDMLNAAAAARPQPRR